jgi:hypothetical protein
MDHVGDYATWPEKDVVPNREHPSLDDKCEISKTLPTQKSGKKAQSTYITVIHFVKKLASFHDLNRHSKSSLHSNILVSSIQQGAYQAAL